jgi:very-short-patch-repair endonuclease
MHEVAKDQHWLISFKQLLEIGFSRAAIHRMVVNGMLFRVRRGVYVVGRRQLSRRGLFLAAVLSVGDDAALTGFAGAALAGFWNGITQPVEVVAPKWVKKRTGIRVYSATDMPPTETRDGIPVTTPEHTILRLAQTMYSQKHFRRLVHEALVQRVTTLPSLLQACDDAPKRTKAVQRVEAELIDGAKPTRSGLEDDVVEILRRMNAPPFETNAPIPGTPDWVEVDVHFTQHKLAIEVDGPHHWTPYRKQLDAYKQRLIEDTGVAVLRLGADAVTPAREPETVALIRAALSESLMQ